MSVRLIDTSEAFAACAANWEAVRRHDATAGVFLSHGWLSDLHRRRSGPYTLAWEDDAGELPYGAFLPLRRTVRLNVERRRFERALCADGNDWADHTGVLCLPGREARALPALGAALAALPRRRLTLDDLALGDSRRELLLSAFPEDDYRIGARERTDNRGTTSLATSPVVRLPASFEAWLEGLAPNTRQRIRRFRRRLDADPELEVRGTDASTRDADLARLRELWLARWAEAKGDGALVKADKYVRIVADGLARGHLHLTALTHREIPVALSACYADAVRRAVSFFVGAREPAFRALPAGLLLHAHEIERAIGEGHARYDLLRGDEPYKYSLGAVDAPLASLDIRAHRLEPEDVLLDPACVNEVLAHLTRAEADARPDTIERLYGQALESWPGEPRVLARYAAWLRVAGEGEVARAIEDELHGGDRARAAHREAGRRPPSVAHPSCHGP